MGVNRKRPHLVVLSEDDATRSLAVGFSDMASGPIDIRLPERGWPKVLQQFESSMVAYLRKHDQAHVLMLIDFDHNFATRMPHFQKAIPPDVADRVYILGAENEAETLKKQQKMHLGPLGAELARECLSQQHSHWVCTQLLHNRPEVGRLNAAVRPFLF